VDTLAYPYGHYDETTLRVARRAGFRLACTVMPGRVSSLLSARLQLPRILVRDWEPDELLRRLAPWSDGR
jgi:peptidoglycan/xylan/chitin deacetylase (PgdA/CDA1 family)